MLKFLIKKKKKNNKTLDIANKYNKIHKPRKKENTMCSI